MVDMIHEAWLENVSKKVEKLEEEENARKFQVFSARARGAPGRATIERRHNKVPCHALLGYGHEVDMNLPRPNDYAARATTS